MLPVVLVCQEDPGSEYANGPPVSPGKGVVGGKR